MKRSKASRLFQLILLIPLVCSVAHAKTGLVFTKKPGREVLYQAGDLITIRTIEYPQGVTRQIKDFDFVTESLVFDDLHVKVKDITHVHLDGKNKNWWFMKHKWGNLFLTIGAGYLAIDLINGGDVKKETLVFSAACVGAGIVAKIFISKWIPVGGRRKLKIVRI